MFSTRESSTSPAAAAVFSEQEEDKTTTVSAATLRDLVARTAEVPAAATPPVPPPPPSQSKPIFLEKSGAILVLPNRSPSAHPAEPTGTTSSDSVATGSPPSADVASFRAPLRSSSPHVADEPISVVKAVPSIERATISRPAPRRAARPRAPYTTWAFLRCRLFALGLLALVVASQPWWWNIGSLRGRARVPAPAHDSPR